MFKVFKDISFQIAKDIFHFRDAMPYQLRQQADFQIPSVHSVFSGTEKMKFLGPKIWEMLPHKLQEVENVEEFRKAKNKGNQQHVHVGYVKRTRLLSGFN